MFQKLSTTLAQRYRHKYLVRIQTAATSNGQQQLTRVTGYSTRRQDLRHKVGWLAILNCGAAYEQTVA